MALHDLRRSLARKLGYADTPSTEVVNRFDGHLNEIHRRLLGLPGVAQLRHATLTTTTVASTHLMSLPAEVERIIGIQDSSNDTVLKGIPWEWYQATEPDPTGTTGTPSVWAPMGYVPYSTPIADASKLYVASTSASDAYKAYVEGIRSGGGSFAEEVTMTGIAGVPAGVTYSDITDVTKFFLSVAAVGTVTLYEDSVLGTVISTIGPGRTYARFLRIAFWPTPAAAYTLQVDYLRRVDDMVESTDEPLLPQDFHWVIEAGAKMLEYERQDDRRYPAAKAEYEKGVRDLKWFITQQADGGTVTAGHSQLGPWYPAGS